MEIRKIRGQDIYIKVTQNDLILNACLDIFWCCVLREDHEIKMNSNVVNNKVKVEETMCEADKHKSQDSWTG